jgi:hypothetical protein
MCGGSQSKEARYCKSLRTLRGRRQGQINEVLDMAADVETVRARRPGNIRAKGLLKEGGWDK